MGGALVRSDGLQFVLEAVDQGILAVDEEGRCTLFNRAASQMTGWSSSEIGGRKIHELIHHSRKDGSRFPEEESPILGVLRTGSSVRSDNEVFWRRDGTSFPVEYSAQAIVENGRIAGVVSAFTDITERTQREEALRDSERQARLVADAGPALISYIDAGCRYRWANKVYESWFGLTADQIRGRHPREVLGHAAWDVVRPNVEHALGGEKVASEHELPMRGGGRRWMRATYTPDQDEAGRVRGIAVHAMDVSDLKQTEESLLREKAFSESAINSMPGVFYLFKAGGKLLRWNHNLEEVTGYSAQEVAEMSPLDFFDADEHANILNAISRVFTEGKANVEASCVTKSGKKMPFYYTGHRMLLDGVPYLIGAGIDITELRQAEARLRQAHKLESLGVLAGGLAHDFNNLLVGVIGNASLAQEMLTPSHPVSALLDAVVKTGERAAHLTSQMLAYSGKGQFVMEALSLSELVSEMCTLIQPSLSKRITLQLDLQEDLAAIEADRGQMQQVFMNLALNAAEAIGANAGRITVTTGVEELDAAYIEQHLGGAEVRPGQYVYLEVSDTGCGMDDATKARIFDPFFSTKFTGRGLGLAAAAGIVRGHKGAIRLSSAPGEGSCFRILFPASQRQIAAPEARRTAAVFHGAGTILVVDDEAIVREMATRTLGRYGFDVLVTDGGRAAIELFKRAGSQVSLILLDLSMPGMSGEQVLPELRKLRPDVRVIVSSGYTEAEAMRMFEGHRVSGFIQKPYTVSRLIEKMHEVLGEPGTQVRGTGQV